MSKKEEKAHNEQMTGIVSSVMAAYAIVSATVQKDKYERFDNYTEFNSALSSNTQYQNQILNMKTGKVHFVKRTNSCPFFVIFYVNTEDGLSIFPDTLFADWCFIDGTPCGKRSKN